MSEMMDNPSSDTNMDVPPSGSDAFAQTDHETQAQTQTQTRAALAGGDGNDSKNDMEMLSISPRLNRLLREIRASPFRARTNPAEADNQFWKETFVRPARQWGYKLGTHCHATATASELAAELDEEATAEEDAAALSASLASLGLSGSPWCSSRTGQSHTTLPDGRTVLIGGKHLDSSEHPSTVFNDVIVISSPDHPVLPARGPVDPLRPEDITIYTYKPRHFPPVYNHAAVFCIDEDGSQCIYIIGGLGPDTSNPRRKETMVHVLDLDDFRIYTRHTDGDIPPAVDLGPTAEGHRYARVRTAAKVMYDPESHLIEFKGGALGGYAYYTPDSSWIQGWTARAKREFQQFAGIETYGEC
ncbi:hypothetical protein B0T19DRAFT_114244 [Cercophora scortea]|uniref:Uncharacterized protein n=1 Tax=Cercophora scortea TaxID=314031 RepID=A0AAE0MHM8_9PEZI|nr:hypothetical protein B0T19DRAFT_114244 [Cercophora scortea]